MSETPETDAIADFYLAKAFSKNPEDRTVPCQFAARLERDLNRAIRERDEARAVADELASAASHCLGWHDCRLRIGEKITATLQRWRSMKGER